MNGQPRIKKEKLEAGITDEEIKQLIAERKRVGATRCDVVTENGQRVLVCKYPPL